MLDGEPAGIRRKPDRSRTCYKLTRLVNPPDACYGLTARANVVELGLVEDNLIHRRDEPTGVYQARWMMEDG